MLTRKWAGGSTLIRGRNVGSAKVVILLSLAACFLLIITAGVQRTTAEDCDCSVCHGGHGPGWQGCATCHGFPPDTASHIKHFGANTLIGFYGDTSITQNFDPNNPNNYQMGCGNCHPLDPSKHKNGQVEVELYNAAASPASLKVRNLSSAAYTPGAETYYDNKGFPYTLGTCSNVYCHSYNDWTTPGGVPTPWPQTQNDPPVPPNTVTTRYYKTPQWGGGSLTCSGCHGNPPSTNYYTNAGGSGDSHAWRDDWGYEDLHGWNMGFMWPVSCTTCHNDTVSELNTWTYGTLSEWYDVAFYGSVPITNYSKHVNGTVDVSFDKIRPLVYRNTFDLLNASYDAGTKTCSNVSCHRSQTSVTWGTPYRWWDSTECNRCHSY
jgi:predicted CxxxxCH...CXXCH cytochrome family protein